MMLNFLRILTLISTNANRANFIIAYHKNAKIALKTAFIVSLKLHASNVRACSIKLQLKIKESIHVRNVIVDVSNASEGQIPIVTNADFKSLMTNVSA